MARAGEGIAILTRAVNIISFVTEAGRSVTIPEIVDGVKLPRPTVHRICNALEVMGLLTRDLERNRLVAGPEMTKIALSALASTEVALPRRAILRRTVDEVHETVSLTILKHDELLFLDRVESASPLRLHLYAGSKAPLHCTSAGKLFMALQPAERRKLWLTTCTLTQLTPSTITNVQHLEQELMKIQADKFSIDNQEYIEGLVAIAVPVFDKRGKMIAAVSVNGPASRVCLDDQERYLLSLRRAAEDLRLCLS